MREVQRHSRAYYFPDEVFLDNLYLEGKGLEWDALGELGVSSVDFRLGRQDLFVGGHSVFGLNRNRRARRRRAVQPWRILRKRQARVLRPLAARLQVLTLSPQSR